MNYLACLYRFENSQCHPRHTNGVLSVYELDKDNHPYGCPVFTCATLEPAVPAVPVGCHNLSITYSPRFSPKLPYRKWRGVPLVSSPNCPERRGIRIHIGNTVADTNGCILVGMEIGRDGILRSRDAYIEFMKFASHINEIYVYDRF